MFKAGKTKGSTYHDSSYSFVHKRSGNRRIVLWGVVFTLLLALLFVFHPTLLEPLNFIIYDRLLRNFPNNHSSSRLVIIDLDEKSLNRYGQWPWPRYLVAELLNKINALEPAVIGLDVLFSEPDGTSAERLLKRLGEAHGFDLSLNWLPVSLTDNDVILADVLATGPFVLGNKFHFNDLEKGLEKCLLHPVKVSLMHKGEEQKKAALSLPESTGVVCSLPLLSERVGASGFFNFSPDQDGMMRRLPLLIQYRKEVYPSLALAMVLKLEKTDHLILKKEGNLLHTLHYKTTSVPVDRHGQMLIKFRGPQRRFDYVSAADVMAGEIPADRLRNRIALLGTSATGMKELRTTPFDTIFPGVEVHATVIDNLLTGDFISSPSWSTGLVLLLILVLGMALNTAIAFNRALSGILILLTFIAGLWLGAHQLFFRTGLFVGPAYPLVSLVAIYMFLTLLKFRLGEKNMIESMRELLLTQDSAIETMASLTEFRSKETGDHIKRTRKYVKLLAEHVRHRGVYRHTLTLPYIDLLYKSATLHDIGKNAISDAILFKPDPLNAEEFEIMKSHTTIGRDVLESSIRQQDDHSFLTMAAEIAFTHHEKWDGSGYPRGLKGEAIPLSGRLMALADVYDALTSKRVYKEPSSHAMALDFILQGRGSHFDPVLVDAFVEIHEQFRNIAQEFADNQK